VIDMSPTPTPALPEQPSPPFELRHASTACPLVVFVPERRLLAIDGTGTREAADFALASEVLRTVAAIVRASLASPPFGFRSVLEVCWSMPSVGTTEEVAKTLDEPVRRWRQMIELPNPASDAQALAAIDAARRLGGRQVPLVRLTRLSEGPAAQVLHLAIEPMAQAVRQLYDFVFGSGLRPAGDLHELVVSDPAVAGMIRGRSILRVPIGLG
jgi:hypothetical protein